EVREDRARDDDDEKERTLLEPVDRDDVPVDVPAHGLLLRPGLAVRHKPPKLRDLPTILIAQSSPVDPVPVDRSQAGGERRAAKGEMRPGRFRACSSPRRSPFAFRPPRL